MDSREAMLRELNLYPMWVRRELPEKVAEVIAVPEVMAEPVQEGMPDVTPVTGVVALPEISSEAPPEAMPEVIQAAMPELELPFFEACEESQSAPDSLETFAAAMKVSGVLASLDWPELKQRVSGCHRCDLREGCTQTVFGVGCEQADWMFVGEAPGFEEDASGEPFVGHAGRLLDNMLLAIKLKRSETYIANVIKCRPEDDRHPHVGEISSCMPYLQRQIGLVQPKLIVALGKTAATALLGTDATIASLRGTVHDYKGIPLIVTYHPAYLLRSPMEKAKAWQDLCLAVKTRQSLPVQGAVDL
ncbi:MAG: uracil-DNA glycosylase [Gallionella sp.]|jgi:DNA polymerase